MESGSERARREAESDRYFSTNLNPARSENIQKVYVVKASILSCKLAIRDSFLRVNILRESQGSLAVSDIRSKKLDNYVLSQTTYCVFTRETFSGFKEQLSSIPFFRITF